MALTRNLTFIGLVLVTLVMTAQGCAFSGEIDCEGCKFMIEPQTINGAGPFGGLISTLGLNIPVQSAIPMVAVDDPKVEGIYLSTIAIRSTTSADFDSNGAAINTQLMNDSLVGPCSAGQPNVDFIQTLEIHVQSQNTGKDYRIAHFSNANKGSCGFFMTPDNDPSTGLPYNLKSLMPIAKAYDNATGSEPSTTLKIGGYVGVTFTRPNSKIPETVPQPNQ